jgi:CheY-like chemotaxis protein
MPAHAPPIGQWSRTFRARKTDVEMLSFNMRKILFCKSSQLKRFHVRSPPACPFRTLRPALPGAMAHADSMYRAFFEQAAHFAALLDLQGNIVEINRVSLALGGYARCRFRPQVAFLDIGMPRLDGYGAARAIRALPGLAPVTLVALTGWGAPEDRRRSREAGFDQHLLKPAVPQQVHALLADCRAPRQPAL